MFLSELDERKRRYHAVSVLRAELDHKKYQEEPKPLRLVCMSVGIVKFPVYFVYEFCVDSLAPGYNSAASDSSSLSLGNLIPFAPHWTADANHLSSAESQLLP